MNLYNLSFRMVFLIHMWEYKKLYPGGVIKLLPPPPHLLCQWLFYLWRESEETCSSVPGDKGAINFFDVWLCSLLFFIRIRTTQVSANISKYVMGHFNFLSCHHALSYLPSQWSCGWSTAWNFAEDFVLMNLLAAAVSASPVPPLHLKLFVLC